MIRIPDTPALQQTAIGMPFADAGVAAAPARALGPLAQGLASLGEHFQTTALKAQQIENARVESEARQQLAGDYSAFQLGLQNEQDPAARLAKTKTFLAGAQNSLVTPDMPPAVRDRLALHAGEFVSRATIAAGEDAARLAEKRADTAFGNEIEAAPDQASALGVVERMRATGAKTPEEMDAIQRKVAYHFDYREAQQAILRDPLGAEKALADPEYLKQHPAATPESVMTLQRQAKTAVREKTYDLISAIHDGMATDYITTPAQIDEIGAGLRPAVLADLKDALAKNQSDAEKQRRATPEYQNQVVGAVTAALADYNPVTDGYDSQFAKMDGAVRSLPEGAIRVELEKNIKDARAQKLDEITTHAQAAMKSLDAAAKDGRFGNLKGTVESEYHTQRFIDAGFLRSEEKLASLGFSPTEVQTIITAKGSTMNAVPNDAARKEMFQSLWEKRGNSDKATAGGLVAATADAILNGTTKVDWIDPEAADAAITEKLRAQEALGLAKTELASWLKVNPKASSKEIDQQVFELAGEETRKRLQAGTYETRAKPIGAGNDSVPASNLIDTVKQFEAGGAPGGFFRTAYWDVHQWSIGYGTRSKQGEVINQAEAEKRLASELAMHRGRVEKANTEYQLGLTPNEVDALTSFDFNTGHLDSLLNGGTRSKAEIAATLPLYRHAGGERLPGLEARRAAEQAIFLNGYAGKAASVPTAPSPVAKNPLKIQPWQPSYRSNPM